MLYVVATPIGNLEDITLRAIRILGEVDFILAEDTRKTIRLLKHHRILFKEVISFHEHNEGKRVFPVIEKLLSGKNCALVSNAGTPSISDPGFKIIKKCLENNISVTSIPGPSSVINGLVLSGLAVDSFCYFGFLPRKKGKREKIFKQIKVFDNTAIILESPYRVLATLNEMLDFFGERQVCLLREMTKLFEQRICGKISEVISSVKGKQLKGEFVIVLSKD